MPVSRGEAQPFGQSKDYYFLKISKRAQVRTAFPCGRKENGSSATTWLRTALNLKKFPI